MVKDLHFLIFFRSQEFTLSTPISLSLQRQTKQMLKIVTIISIIITINVATTIRVIILSLDDDTF